MNDWEFGVELVATLTRKIIETEEEINILEEEQPLSKKSELRLERLKKIQEFHQLVKSQAIEILKDIT